MITLTTFLKNCFVNIFLVGFISMSSFSANEYIVIRYPHQFFSQSGLFVFNNQTVVLLHILALCLVLPPKMKVHDSTDGTDNKLLAENQIPPSDSPTWEMIPPDLSFTLTEIRFLKLKLKSGNDCPSGSPHRIDGEMVFMNEICLK